MDRIFTDLLTRFWWAWIALLVSIVTFVALMVGCCTSRPANAFLAIASLAGVTVFLAPSLYRALKNGHRHVPTVATWTLFLVVAFIVCFFYCFIVLLPVPQPQGAYYDKILNILPVLPAMWAALIGWYVHYQFSAKAHRTNNSFSIIMEMRKSAEYLRRKEILTRHFPPGTQVDESYRPYFDAKVLATLEAKKATGTPPTAQELAMADAIDSLRYALNYFEFMAAGVKAKDLDEDLLYETISPQVTGLWKRASLFIEYMQRPVADGGAGEPLAFEHLCALADGWDEKLRKESAAVRR
jgi:hypothetical protein